MHLKVLVLDAQANELMSNQDEGSLGHTSLKLSIIYPDTTQWD